MYNLQRHANIQIKIHIIFDQRRKRLMLNSQRIKLIVTNNQQHLKLAQKIKIQKSCKQQIIKSLKKTLKNIQGKQNYCNEYDAEMFEQRLPIYTGNGNEDKKQELELDLQDGEYEQKGRMFTIRQQSSIDYQSEFSMTSRQFCTTQVLQNISTIKFKNSNPSNPSYPMNKQKQVERSIQSFNLSNKSNQYETITKQNSHQKSPEQIEKQEPTICPWLEEDQNINDQELSFQTRRKQVQQEKTFKISQTQGISVLPKMILDSKLNLLHDPGHKTKHNIGIVYQCSDQQFSKVLNILSKQGIQMIQEPCRINTHDQINKKRGIRRTLSKLAIQTQKATNIQCTQKIHTKKILRLGKPNKGQIKKKGLSISNIHKQVALIR